MVACFYGCCYSRAIVARIRIFLPRIVVTCGVAMRLYAMVTGWTKVPWPGVIAVMNAVGVDRWRVVDGRRVVDRRCRVIHVYGWRISDVGLHAIAVITPAIATIPPAVPFTSGGWRTDECDHGRDEGRKTD